MFDGIAEHEVAEHGVAEHDCFFFFYEIAFSCICFFLIYFYLTIWYINVKSCIDGRPFFIILAELSWDTILLLYQLVFCTFTLFGTLKIHYDYDQVGIALGLRIKRSLVRLPSPMILFFCARYFFFNYNIHDIFPSQYYMSLIVINFIYIFYNRKSCTNLSWNSILK